MRVKEPKSTVGKIPFLVFWMLNSISLRFFPAHPNSGRNLEIWRNLAFRALDIFCQQPPIHRAFARFCIYFLHRVFGSWKLKKSAFWLLNALWCTLGGQSVLNGIIFPPSDHLNRLIFTLYGAGWDCRHHNPKAAILAISWLIFRPQKLNTVVGLRFFWPTNRTFFCPGVTLPHSTRSKKELGDDRVLSMQPLVPERKNCPKKECHLQNHVFYAARDEDDVQHLDNFTGDRRRRRTAGLRPDFKETPSCDPLSRVLHGVSPLKPGLRPVGFFEASIW